MIVKPASIDHAPEIAALVQASFAPRLRPYMIYTQKGISHFLAALIDHPGLFPDRRLLTCADENGAPIGFAEFRLNGSSALLSYICVAPHARRRGVASALVTSFLDDQPGLTLLELDVFEDNAPAIALYQRMGFTGSARTIWFVRSLPSPREGAVIPHNPAAALAAFDRYGFCELAISWRGSEHRLGRIGASVLRCFSSSDYGDQDLLAAMRLSMPELREALLIQSADEAMPSIGRQANVSLRLSLGL